MTLLTGTNETVYGLWNTIAGGSNTLSTSGSSIGNYYPMQMAGNAFDQINTTKYCSFGNCSISSSSLTCGTDTGLYLTLQRGASLLLAVQFRAANDNFERDPFTITIEGSNQPSSALSLGSSWTLIYNGVTGLDPDPGRYINGTVQDISNNVVWYTSYRLLATSKRNISDAVQYGEVMLFGY
jgi:hypothetical protein